ncbi:MULTISPECIES: hypothetical protein [unclassified Mesorhizobium]|nr:MULTISPECIES: hypothetical protein [unclassified Mesorhizobium]
MLFALYAMAEPLSHHHHSVGEDAFAVAKNPEGASKQRGWIFTLVF